MVEGTRQPDTLLREIQEAAAGSEVSVIELLRKAQILAARLDHQPLKDWIRWEMDGYPKDAELPEYRRLGRVQVLGDFGGAFGSGLRNALIAEVSFGGDENKWLRETWFRHDFYDGVPSLESLVEAESESFRVPWPADLVAVYGHQMYEGMACLAAWQVIPRGVVVHLLNAVRSKLLAFALEIEVEAPDAGEAAPGEHPVSEERVTQIFTTNIYGDQATVAAGNRDVVQRPVNVQLQVNLGRADCRVEAARPSGSRNDRTTKRAGARRGNHRSGRDWPGDTKLVRQDFTEGRFRLSDAGFRRHH